MALCSLSHKELDTLLGRAHVLPVLASRDLGLYYKRCCSSAQEGPREAGPAPAISFVHAHAAPPCPKCAGRRSTEVTQAAQRNHSWNGAPFGDSESKAHFIAAFQIPSIVRAFPL